MLGWNEIRNRARSFVDEFADATYEKGETQTFYNEFFEIFGLKRRQVARYEEHVKKLNDTSGFIDLFWPRVLLVEQKSAGRDLKKAADQAGDYFDAIRDRDKPRFQLLCDFQNFELLDRDTREHWSFTLNELPDKVDLFAFMLGREKRKYVDQDPVNIEASELMGHVHDDLEASGYSGHQLEVYLVRLLFMLFADDTGIFEPRDHLLDVIENRTNEDGSDLGMWLQRIFEVLNTPEDARGANLDEDLNRFPYVNGDLFLESLPMADFTSAMRENFLEACRFNWQAVSPAIFGSLFQSVMNPEERRKKGAHYTTEKNIMKVIGPLFLDELRAEFEHLKGLRAGRAGRLEAFRRRLGTLTFLDPACGCGNFLIIAYRELRKLEIEVLQALLDGSPIKLTGENRIEQLMRTTGTRNLSNIDVDQFYGIELGEFPARIAEVAMWMMDHIMNNRMSLAFGQIFTRIPLRKSPHIKNADALEMEWNDLLPAHQCSYVMGNPPFSGFVLRDAKASEQLKRLERLGASGGRLDLVCYWFLLAAEYLNRTGCKAGVAFVATNSITQGEQVAQLWPTLFERFKLEVAFGHRTFEWGSEARGKAHVHVVIVGLTRRDMERETKRLFSYENIRGEPEETRHKALTAYLFEVTDGANRYRVVRRSTSNLSGVPSMRVGTKPVDNGHFILDNEERLRMLGANPELRPYIRPFVGGYEHLNNVARWIIHAQSIPPIILRRSPEVIERIRSVRNYREHAKGKLAKSLAENPTSYHVTVVPDGAFIGLAEVSSERREYIPAKIYYPPLIPSNKLLVIKNANHHLLGVLLSLMHASWLKYIGGRLKSDYSYSSGLVYNTFPWPRMNEKQEQEIGELAQAVLDARDNHPGATLADLYDPDLMPPDLRRAHRALDRAVDRLYRARPFESERERVEHLFTLYEKLVAPVEAEAKRKTGRGTRR